MSTVTLERTFCKFCRVECFEEEDKRYQAHKDCINTFPICDKCGNATEIFPIRELVNHPYKYLCLACVKSELERRTNILLSQIQGQYSLSPHQWIGDSNKYKVTATITIEEVTQ